jgi:thioredoxin 1
MTPLFVGTENFEREVLQAEKPVMVDFFTPTCLSCRRLEPVAHQMSRVFRDEVKIAFLNVEDAPEIAQRYQVMQSPTLLFFKEGRPVDILIGFQDSEHLTAHLHQVLRA